MAKIFYDSENEQPIKFFIQKDLPEDEIARLERNITDNGGVILSKIPIHGFILIKPASAEAIRLINCWRSEEHPRRYFIPYTFVQECLTAGKLLPQVFRAKDGSRLKFYIHTSVNDEDILRKLNSQIQHSGGKVVRTKEKAEIIIADERWDGFEPLRIYYDDTKAVFVEGVSWVKKCIATETLRFTPVKRKNVGGRITGSKRTEFTSKDDNHLAQYIATKLPHPGMRGRTGNKLYKDLCNKLEMYPWAVRHPWQSWRERYRNNIDRFNNLISNYVEFGPNPKRPDAEYNDSNSEPEGGDVPSPKKAKPEEEMGSTKDREEWDGSQWSIKVGTREPPPWGNMKKRPLEEGETDRETSKRVRITDTNGSPATLKSKSPDAPQCNTSGEMQIMNDESQDGRPPDLEETMPASDTDRERLLGEETQEFLEANRRLVSESPTLKESFKPELIGIATRYRFLLEEIEEEFQELGQDLQATELYFREIREYIIHKKRTRQRTRIQDE